MSVIIRLQNLPWSANALDIRQFFHGLSIPEGGVHIVGGEQGDAFIAFSTDEDARQAMNRSNEKIKEIQIKLMLSSRTEMQRVIEAARTQSYAAFMQPAATLVPKPMPAAVPQVIPAAVPEIKKVDKNDKKDGRRRSRSKSRDRKDRSRERRRHRDRSRSRSRERRDRRRRDRSRSRGRSRSKDRDRKSRDRKQRSGDRNIPQKDIKKDTPVWANQNSNDSVQSGPVIPPLSVSPFIASLENARKNLNASTASMTGNGFQQNNLNMMQQNRQRDSWPPNNLQNQINNFQNRSDMFQNNPRQNKMGNNISSPFPPKGFQRNFNNYDDEKSNSESPNTCIKLTPFYGGYGDVRRFFHGLFISNKGIKFINDERGHRTGVVFVQFGHEQGKLEALAKNGEHLNGIKVEIAHLDEDEFEDAIDKYMPSNNYSQGDSDDSRNGRGKFRSKNITKYFNNGEPDIKDFQCLIVDDLPNYAKEQDILHMFSVHPLFSLILTPKPRGGHIAYVKFSNPEVAKKAYEEKNHHIVQGKAVTVRPCKDEEFDAINKQHDVDLAEPKVEDIGTDCVTLQRLPLHISDRDICDFFSDIGISPVKIHLMSNHLGFTGEAHCEFANNEEAARALKKDDTMLGNNNIRVMPIGRQEMHSILGHTVSTELPVPSPIGDNRPPPFMHQMNQNRPMFNNRNNFDNNMRGGPRFGPRGGGGPRQRFGGPPQNMNNDNAPPGCTVYLDNVPYRAGTNDILDFFEGYGATNNVSRRFNSNNTPSAEAKVVFMSREDAFRAVQEKNGQKIWNRPIMLKQV